MLIPKRKSTSERTIRSVPLEFIPELLLKMGKIEEPLAAQLNALWEDDYPQSIIEQLKELGFTLKNKSRRGQSKFGYFNIHFNDNLPENPCKSIW